MANLDEEMQILKTKNNDLVQKVQYWMMTAGQRKDENLALMKENNELRLKLSRLRSSGGALATNLDTAIQTSSEQAISLLVQASTEIAHITEVAKAYMRDRLELETITPRWSTLSGSPNVEKRDRVHRVPPLMIGGQSIQPVVALSRTLLNTRPEPRNVNQNRSVTVHAVPMHMLQDVYIPLTRIDAGSRQTSNTNAESGIQNDSSESSADDSDVEDRIEDRVGDDSQNMSEGDYQQQSRLEPVSEDVEPMDEATPPPGIGTENPLEGPSWLLDAPTNVTSDVSGRRRVNLEPDSTTGADEVASESSPVVASGGRENEQVEGTVSLHMFTPTVRRRKRTCPSPVTPAPIPRSPVFSPPKPNPARRNSMNGRVLKVLVAKMRLGEPERDVAAGASPPKRSARESVASGSPFPSPSAASPHYARFDAPSPNGATDARVIVSEAKKERDNEHERENNVTGEPLDNGPDDMWRNVSRRVKQECNERKSRTRSNTSSDSDSTVEWPAEGRTRRNRKPVTYTEKPLNRKMRR